MTRYKQSRIIILVAAIILLIAALSSCSTETMDTKVDYMDVNPEKFEELMVDDYLLLDVRTQGEFDAGNIEGALLIPFDELEERISEVEDYKEKTVLVYCRSGNRSSTASKTLIDNGFTKVYNLESGIGSWNTYKGN